MNGSFEDLEAAARSRFPEAFASAGDGAFALEADGIRIVFARLPGEPSTALVRARVLEMAEVPRAGDFAKAALAGNFFWGGARGATLSVGPDGALHLTERRPLDELADAEGLEGCIADFAESAADWRERSALYV
jgi:hypothetical protein